MNNSNYSDNKNNGDISELVQTILVLVAAIIFAVLLLKPKNFFPIMEATPTNTIAIKPSEVSGFTSYDLETLAAESLGTKVPQNIKATIITQYIAGQKTVQAQYIATYQKENPNPVGVISTDSYTYDPSSPNTYENPRIIYPSCPLGCKIYQLECNIKGNISFDTKEKIYHLPGQTFYAETEINPDYGERWFCTEEEAIANGWRKSSN